MSLFLDSASTNWEMMIKSNLFHRLVVRNQWNNLYRALLAQYLTYSRYLSSILMVIMLMRSIIDWDRKIGKKIGTLKNRYAIYCLFSLYFNVFANNVWGFCSCLISSFKVCLFMYVFRIPTLKSGFNSVIKPGKK